MIRAIVVDDDVPALSRMRSLLAPHGDVHVVEECGGGKDAVAALRRHAPDLVLLDVEMPDLDGFGVIGEVGAARMPGIIFTSAFSDYAVRAFEAYALDYLLKPFDSARLSAALDRVRTNMTRARGGGSVEAGADPRVAALLRDADRPHRGRHPNAIAVRTGDQFSIVRLSDVDWIEADGNYSRLYVQRRPRLVTKTLAALEAEVLDPELFARVHRSAIVNLDKIVSAEPTEHGDMMLVLLDGTRVAASRRYRDRLKHTIYFPT